MATCSMCDHDIHCGGGCYLICVNDCEDCIYACEPTVVTRQATAGETTPRDSHTMVRVIRRKGGTESHIWMVDDPDHKRYPHDTKLKLCFKDVPRSTIARAMSRLLTTAVRAAEGLDNDKISGDNAAGTAAEIAAKLSLIVD